MSQTEVAAQCPSATPLHESKEMKEHRLKLLLAIIALAVFATIASSTAALKGSGSQRPRHTVSRARRTSQLRNVDQLKEAFQRDSGKVRLVALLSPT